MVQVNLIRQQLKTVEFVCNIPKSKQLQIENTFSFHVAYDPKEPRCRAHLQQCALSKENEDEFRVTVDVFGFFTYTGIQTEEDKKEAHIQAYQQLFPYAQSLISYLTSNAGIPSFVVPRAVMDPNRIKVGKKEERPPQQA
ncbi:MAG: protein-export chaperone SecB [Oscillospiraceae bacterium]|nr:protein-export chaperone SecB [Oscillospiraceae bacterium]